MLFARSYTTSGMEHHPEVPRVFLDSTVLFSAMYSTTGAAYQLIILGLAGVHHLVVSPYVLTEVERNLRAKAPRALGAFTSFTPLITCIDDPARSLVERAAELVVAKDAPIVAAAVSCNADFLATFDRADLISQADAIYQAFEITVVLPVHLISGQLEQVA